MNQHPNQECRAGQALAGLGSPVRLGDCLRQPDRVLQIPEESVFADPDDVKWRKERKDYIKEHGEFLQRYRWHLFLTMTFPWKLNDENAMKAAESWLGMLGPDVYAYVAYEEGRATGRGHLHLFVGGLTNGGKVLRENNKWFWRYNEHDFEITSWNWAFWNKTIKVDHVDIYDHKKGAAWYLSKYTFDAPEHGQFMGKPKKPRRRKRGKRNRGREGTGNE